MAKKSKSKVIEGGPGGSAQHPANCVCVDCEAAAEDAAAAVRSVDHAQLANDAGHPPNCICTGCVADVNANRHLQPK